MNQSQSLSNNQSKFTELKLKEDPNCRRATLKSKELVQPQTLTTQIQIAHKKLKIQTKTKCLLIKEVFKMALT